MPYVDLIWTGMAAIGGLLLIDNLPNMKAKAGVWLIFIAFIFQTYWEITHPWKSLDSLLLVIGVSIIIVIGIPMVFRNQLFKRKK